MHNVKELAALAYELGFHGPNDQVYGMRDWLRERHAIHVEVGSIWDEATNTVESYFYTVTAPIHIYHLEPVYNSGGASHEEMLVDGIFKGLNVLKQYNSQKSLHAIDDELIIAYLKGYGDRNNKSGKMPHYKTNVESYAYLRGKQGDYIEEGLTDEDIVKLVRNPVNEKEQLKLK